LFNWLIVNVTVLPGSFTRVYFEIIVFFLVLLK